jgi:hypothetical protein
MGKTIWKSRVVLLSASAIAAMAAAGMLRIDRMLSLGFDQALETSRPGLSFGPPAGSSQGTAGDEGYWLSRADVESSTPLFKPLSVGDRITISGSDRRERKLEVIDLKAIGDPILRAGTNAAQTRLLLVTCKVMNGDGSEAPVRFIVEAEAPAPAAPAPSKAL